MHLLKLGTVKQGGAQHRRSNRQGQAGLPALPGKSEKRGPPGQVQGVSLGRAALPIVLLVASLVGTLQV